MSHKLKEVLKNISIDCVIFGFNNNELEVLLIKRAVNPYKDYWALPGGFIKKNELVKEAADRILFETTGINNIFLEEFEIFDSVDRFPLWRVLTLGHYALISPNLYHLSTGSDSLEVKWFSINELPDLPFDHLHIINTALMKLRNRVRYKPIGFELLPAKFTLPQLQKLYEVILGKELDKRNFRKKIMKMKLLKMLNEKDKNNIKRPALLYKFDNKNYNRLKEKGFVFEI
ncbi:MAG: NUDIX hydrolase [Melioribacteraceae bacterium]|nr:NUDIX hydrolase [Melioribacteraceae bacterium]